MEHFGTIAPWTVAGAGLVDGINPCAFTVIVFFISFLSLQGYRRRQIAVIGFTFIFAVFLTYLLLGLGVFQVFYSMRFFWVLRMALNYIVGGVTAVLGILAVRDIIVFARTGSTEAMALQLPESVKKKIHAVIGDHYRRRSSGGEKESLPLLSLIASAFVTGFLVSLLEAVCTGQIYLPTITFVLKTTRVKLQALMYLLAYNIMFVMPLLAVLALALIGVGSKHFSDFFKKNFIAVKAAMALLFFGLAFFLFWKG
jgi:cytochrome c biogenesis protein CcdA